MKKISFMLLFCLMTTMVVGQNDTITLKQITKDVRAFTNDTLYKIDTKYKAILPNFNKDSIFIYYKKLFNLGEYMDLKVDKKRSHTKDSIDTYRYDQYYKNILVEYGGGSIKAVNNFVESARTYLRPVNNSTTVLISKEEAIRIAVKATPAKKYRWEWYAKGTTREEMLQDTTAQYYPKCILMYANSYGHKSRLVYQVYVAAHQPQLSERLLIDPTTGEVLTKHSMYQHCSACTYSGNETNLQVNTLYKGAQNINVQDCSFATTESNDNNGKGYRAYLVRQEREKGLVLHEALK